MPTVDLITTRFGGPTNWAYALSKAAVRTPFTVRVHSKAARTLVSPFWTTADLVHTVLPIVWHAWKKPILLTVKGDFRVERHIWRKLYPIAIQKASRVTVPSLYLRDALGLSKAEVIPNAVDIQSYKPHTKPPGEVLEFLTVTKFWFREKAEGVVRMAKNISAAMQGSQRPYHLTVLGEGPYLKSVSAQVQRLGIPVTFIGAAAPKLYYEHSDIFLYYSLHDNMPNAVLEAMASGLPIVSNTVGAIPEMLTHKVSGMIARDDSEYVDSLRQLVVDENLQQKLGLTARQTIHSKFSWSVILPKFIAVYDALLA